MSEYSGYANDNNQSQEVETVNPTSGEIAAPAPQPQGLSVRSMLQPTSLAERAKVYNAINNAMSLSEVQPGVKFMVKGLNVQPGTIKHDDGSVDACFDTTLIGADGKGYFSKAAGIADSARALIQAFGTVDKWPAEGLPMKVVEKPTGKGGRRTKKLEVDL